MAALSNQVIEAIGLILEKESSQQDVAWLPRSWLTRRLVEPRCLRWQRISSAAFQIFVRRRMANIFQIQSSDLRNLGPEIGCRVWRDPATYKEITMHVSTTKEALALPLALVAGAADARGQIPMLATVLLKTINGKLSMLCSDTAVLARALTECTVGKEGEIAIDAKRFNDLVRALPEKQSLDLSLEEKGTLLIKSGRSRFRLPTLPAADYPRMVSAKEQRVTINIPTTRLSEMIEQVQDAIAVADIRPYLNGVLVSLQDGFLCLVATDGFRMVVTREPIAGSEQISKSVILPRKTALLARRLMTQSGDVKVAIGTTDVTLSFADGTVLIGKSIEGQFPAFAKAIPQTAAAATLESRKLCEAIGLIDATTEASDKKQGRAVEMKFTENTLTLSSGEQSRCEIDAVCPTPNTQELAFNVDFLRSAADTLGRTGEKLRVCFPDAANVICIRPAEADYPLAVVMGLRK